MSLSIQIEPQIDGDGDGGSKSAGRWTQEEHNMFLQGLQTHQKQWKLIADMVKTRTVVQIRTHAQKYFQKLHKTTGWNKFDKMDDPNSPISEHDGQRNFAYPGPDSRAGSFCSSGDSVDSNGTSAEGVDSEGEANGQRHSVGKPRSNTMRSNSFGFDIGASSGATSTTNSTLSSPTAAGHNAFVNVNGVQVKRPPQPNVLKVKNELVRKRSRDSIKAMLPGDGKASAPSPKKSYSDAHFVSSLKCKPDPDVHPSRANSGTSPSIVFRSQVYNPATDCYSVHAMPGPLHGLPDDLGAGMGLGLDVGQDFYFPSGTFPDDPYGAFPGHLGCHSNDTDLTNPSGYHARLSGSLGGLMDPDFIDDADLMNMLGTLDWNEPVPGAAESVSSTCTNSRPLSPYTDTASSVCSSRANPVPRPTTAAAPGPAAQGKAPSPVPPSPAQPAALAPTAVGIADTAECGGEDAPVHKKHRVAFSNVLEELELVSQAVRGKAAGADGAADHISLFDLFQRDGAQSVGRLPPLRTLVEQARERSNKSKAGGVPAPAPASRAASSDATATIPASASNTAAPAASTGLDFDDHEFDFSNFMNEDFDAHGMDCGNVIPLSHAGSAASSGTSQRGPSPHGMFPDASNIMDASGGINPGGALLNLNMVPSVKSISAPSTANNTPTVVQRKRGRPRKYSLTNPSAPVGTPSAATAKSLLPPLGQNNTAYGASDHHGYAVPVNATVAQAYNFAVNSALGNNNGEPFIPFAAARSTSGDYGCSAQLSSLRVASHSGDQPSFNPSSFYNTSADIRLGLTRTMSSESDTMLAAQFDLRLYDSDMGMGMLEDFE